MEKVTIYMKKVGKSGERKMSAWVAALILTIWFSTGHAAYDSLQEAMTEHLQCYPVEILGMNKQKPSVNTRDLCLASIYHEMGAEPLWVNDQGPGEKASIIRSFLEKSYEEGLDPGNYGVEKLRTLWESDDYTELARLDTIMTYNIVKYVHDVSSGEIQPLLENPELFPEAGNRNFDPLAIIQQIQSVDDLESYLRSLPPDHVQYAGLKRYYVQYTKVAAQSGFTPIPGGKTIRPGDIDDRIPRIEERLDFLDNLRFDDEQSFSSIYTEQLEEKIRKFQEVHGLEIDGIIGRNTLKELNVTIAQRAEQIRINLARWRWQDHKLGNDYILVNIADFQLFGVKDGVAEISMPVIVGKFQHQTPVFSDAIKYLEINPYWNVPPSIAAEEELVELRQNPHALIEKKIRLFSGWKHDSVELDSTLIDWELTTSAEMRRYKLRQDPGPFNALGTVKFVFPNEYAVYLHDTPAKNLFKENSRSFSHGCIRVADPQRLVRFILQDNEKEWSRIALDSAFENEKRVVIAVRPSLPVHLTYQTAWVDKDDQIHFNRDVYGRDEKLFNTLFSN